MHVGFPGIDDRSARACRPSVSTAVLREPPVWPIHLPGSIFLYGFQRLPPLGPRSLPGLHQVSYRRYHPVGRPEPIPLRVGENRTSPSPAILPRGARGGKEPLLRVLHDWRGAAVTIGTAGRKGRSGGRFQRTPRSGRPVPCGGSGKRNTSWQSPRSSPPFAACVQNLKASP